MMPGQHQVLYLTGAPAAGKSSATRLLRDMLTSVSVFEYGERLTALISERCGGLAQDQLREHSAQIVTHDDIRELDRRLIAFVETARQEGPVVIDSHAVTKESYGFRVTPYSLSELALVRPSAIGVLYTPPETTLRRIASDPGGRPMVTTWEADFHTQLQAGVAVTYAIGLGVPLYFIDSSATREKVAQKLLDILTK